MNEKDTDAELSHGHTKQETSNVNSQTTTSKSLFSRYLSIFLKTILFNLFALGLILNLVTFTSIDWIVGENYVIGILKYCKGTEMFGSNRLVFYNSRLVHQSSIDELKCFYWNQHNKPS